MGALWVADCACPELDPPPVCVWLVSWEVVLAFPLWAVAWDEFVWLTGPSLPGLSTLMTTFTFVGATWVDFAVAFDSCFAGAL